jgi:hypothetical protein
VKGFARLALLAVVAATAAGCSGGGSSASTSAPSTSTAVATTVADTAGATTPPDAATTTTVYRGPVFPLTGLPVTDPAAAARPALVVKIDNHALARPQSGLNEADIVYEEMVEVQTRFAAVFHSHGADPVGPIRSGRTQDIDLLGSLNKPLFAWSGGNANVTFAINSSDLISLNNVNPNTQKEGGFFRSADRKGPHNLYATTSKLWTLAPPDAEPPQPQFQYLGARDHLAGDASSGTEGDIFGLAIRWNFDRAKGVYLRSSDGQADRDTLDGQVSTDNVVVLSLIYKPSGADARSPEAQTVGTGEVMVFTQGVVVHGTWVRGSRLQPFKLTDDAGAPILLTPGRTWVELASPDKFSPLP